MRLHHRSILFAIAMYFTVAASAQMGKIPVAVTTAFTKQYKGAAEVSYEDHLTEYKVHFIMDTIKMTARYNSKGVWKGSEKETDFNRLSADVKDGFSKSKYNDWKVINSAVLLLPEKEGGGEQYLIKVRKGDLQKKYLYFNRSGKLVRDNLAL